MPQYSFMTMLGKIDGLVYLSELCLSSPVGDRMARNEMISGAGSSSEEIQLKPRKDNRHEGCSGSLRCALIGQICVM